MAYSKVVASLLVALISSLISCVQINAAVINLHNQYIRDRQDVLRLLSMNSGHHKVKKRANHHRRRFWTRPGRTSAWWDNFINGTMIEEEWKENFRMSKSRHTCQYKISSRCSKRFASFCTIFIFSPEQHVSRKSEQHVSRKSQSYTVSLKISNLNIYIGL